MGIARRGLVQVGAMRLDMCLCEADSAPHKGVHHRLPSVLRAVNYSPMCVGVFCGNAVLSIFICYSQFDHLQDSNSLSKRIPVLVTFIAFSIIAILVVFVVPAVANLTTAAIDMH